MRTVIATDLHDDIGSSLSQIAILSEVARVRGDDRASEPLQRIATLARELVDSMSDIVWSIRTEPDDVDSLTRRMREFALDLLSSQGIEFELRAPRAGENWNLSLNARRSLFLMFKECIHNAVRHAQCSSVIAELRLMDHELMLRVEDNGIGLNGEAKASGRNDGTGISGMRWRVRSLGGRMDIAANTGKGCCVTIWLPVRRGVLA